MRSARVPFVSTPLTAPVDPRAAAAAGEARRGRGGRGTGREKEWLGWTIVAVVLGLPIAGILVVMMIGLVATGLWLFAIPVGVFLVGTGALVGWLIVVGGRKARQAEDERRYRFSNFARANAMEYLPEVPKPPLPGIIFDPARSNAIARDVVRGREPRMVEFGNYEYVVSTGKSTHTVRKGYVAIRVDNLLPHIILDARMNDPAFGSNLGLLQKQQRLSLEGDFDRFFTLYCPTGYEVDALYLFTPDIMLRMMTQAAVLDVELVDNWVFFYSPEDLSTLRPEMWEWLFSLVHAMLQKLAQWERWRDDRLAGIPRRPIPGAPIPGAPTPGAPTPGAQLPVLPAGTVAPQVTAPSPAALAASAATATAAVPFPDQPRVTPPLTPRPPGVAEPGRRLRRGVPVALWIVLVLFLVIGAIGLLGTLLAFGSIIFASFPQAAPLMPWIGVPL